ncbi:N-succinylarginine dihydrolase [Allohahella marinimesophila]|uniref:N-succinylarginine dihydrolase n=1 Tax=Allohahella marinimesophila TaxID=1054972 RepID=A0ABP7P4G3_9GAMM
MQSGNDSATEANFDGLVGPTHSYSGLSLGNVASTSNRQAVSNPRDAALQGLDKMLRLAELGFVQGVLPPHFRPALSVARRLGFSGTDAQVLKDIQAQAPYLLGSLSSASSMWTANAATVTPSADSRDGRVHFTPANLNAKFHRSFEHLTSGRALAATFRDDSFFAHHEALPAVAQFGDEGAANHTRLCAQYGKPGVHFFVYGREGFDTHSPRPARFHARQTLEASQAIARQHGLSAGQCVFALQSPAVIDAGVFHNDVIAVGNANVLFYHEAAFHDEQRCLGELTSAYEQSAPDGPAFTPIRVASETVSVADAVASYLFNSQLLSRHDGAMLLLVPVECERNPRVRQYLEDLVDDQSQPIREVLYADLTQSMLNGGGPACLRLRVVLTPEEQAAANPACFIDHERHKTLSDWVKRHYRDRLTPQDLADPALLGESQAALDELTGLLNLGSIYEFQR